MAPRFKPGDMVDCGNEQFRVEGVIESLPEIGGTSSSGSSVDWHDFVYVLLGNDGLYRLMVQDNSDRFGISRPIADFAALHFITDRVN